MANSGRKGSLLRHRTGLLRDSPDHRDFIRRYGEDEIPSTDDHPVVDLRKYVIHVFEQFDLDSCTPNVVCAAYELLLQKQARELNHVHYDFDTSRLFVYYNARKINFDTQLDTGASLRNALQSINRWGVCHEALWPYKISDYAKEPPPACYTDAERNKITKYERLTQDQHQLRACLKEGYPFAFGIEIYDSFELKIEDDGVMPLPSDEEIQDGPSALHGVLCVGYNDNTQCFTVLNSWGEYFGDDGYFYMPYKYMMIPERAFDFWKISEVTESNLNSNFKK